MCLNAISKKTGYEDKTSIVAWKVFGKSNIVVWKEFGKSNNGLKSLWKDSEASYKTERWIRARRVVVTCSPLSLFGLKFTYNSGFHAFLTRRNAREVKNSLLIPLVSFVVRKVRLRGPKTFGTQIFDVTTPRGCPCVVGDEMFISKSTKG